MNFSVVKSDMMQRQVMRMSAEDKKAPGRLRGLLPRWCVTLLVLLLAGPILPACGDDTVTGPPQRPRRDRTSTSDAAQEALANLQGFEEAEEYSRPDYPVRRNPFQPDIQVLGVNEDKVDPQQLRPVEPLEEYALSSLRLVTIISETTVPKAMFVDPTGFGHFAKEGDRIGRNNGIIRNIRQNEVEIREGDEQGSMITVRMREGELRQDDDSLSEEEQEALRRLLQSEGGRQALQRSLQGTEESQHAQGGAEPVRQDERFSGIAPPGRE